MQVIKGFGALLFAWVVLMLPVIVRADVPDIIGTRCIQAGDGAGTGRTYGWRQVSPIQSRIHGSIDLIPGYPATSTLLSGSGQIGIVDSPRRSLLRENARFELLGEEPFEGCLRMQAEIVVAGTNERIVRAFSACMTGQFDEDEENCHLSGVSIEVPPVVMTRPTTITGTFPGVNATVANDVYVAVDALGIAVPVSASGTFIIPGLPPGLHRIELRPFNPQTTTIRGTSWMNAAVWSGLQSNHIGSTVTVSRQAMPSPATAPLSATVTPTVIPSK